MLQLYHDHEHLVKSTEQLSTTLSTFKSSKSASLRAFAASQLTLDIQGSSSEEFLNHQGASSETLQNGIRGGNGGHNRPFSTLSLHRCASSEVWGGQEVEEFDDDLLSVGGDDFFGSVDVIGDLRHSSERSNTTSHKRYLSLG